MVPADIIVQRAQATDDLRKDSVHVVRSILRSEGVLGFYRSYWTSIAVWGPYCSIYFSVYEGLKGYFGVKSEVEASGLVYFACSTAAAMVGTCITNPLDVIRVRSMVDGHGGLGGMHFRYKSISHAAWNIMKKEGWLAFGKGLKARAIWYVAADAISMTLYEKLKHWF